MMKIIKRSVVGFVLVIVLFLSFVILIVGGGSVDSQTYNTTTGGISITAKDFA